MRLTDIIDFKTFSYKWDVIETIPEFAKLKECEQNAKWHSEGTAWEHTKLVCKEASNICINEGWGSNDDWTKILMASALFHDIGKGPTTEFKKGNWHSYGHEVVGDKITRRMLWDEGYELREDICSLVKWHMEPLNVFNSKHYLDKLINLSKNIRCWHILLLLKRCDILGSKPEDENVTTTDLAKLEDLISLTTKLGCYYKKSTIPEHRQLKHLLTNNGKKNITVHMLFGLPGAGKSTVVEKIINSFKGPYSVVSRDIARAELGFCAEGEKIVGTPEQEKKVTEKCDEMIMTAACLGENIIIDNTNLKKAYRDHYHTLLKDYNVAWSYVYVEATKLEKNISRRDGMINADVFENMIRNFEWPSADEYDILKTFLN